MAKSQYVYNRVMYSSLTKSFYFVPKAKVITATNFEVIGKKYNVTDSIQSYLLKRYRKA